uniref:Sterol carrier protein 2 n=1 Tax=Strigamia maritima TaxID=126957 RepID=T1JC52_STRMM
MSRRVYVIGVGMTKFEKPGRRENFDYPDMCKEAVGKALDDAKISFRDIQQACVGYVYGDSTCGQRALYPVGMTGIPIVNVNNNCSTGSSALFLANQLISGGIQKCVLALGFEKMQRGSLTSQYSDRTNPMDKHVEVLNETYGMEAAPFAAQLFGAAGREHMDKYGTKPEHFAKIAWKNHKHSTNNPYSQFQDEYSLEEIMNSPEVYKPLTKLQCCPTSDGAAAAILADEEFIVRNNLKSQAVEILGMNMATDLPSAFQEKSCIKMIGYDMTKTAVDKLYQNTGYKASDVHVVELHDCFSANELITYEALGLCPPGKGGEFVDSGNNTYGGKYVINPSGGLISKGHPLGATGLAQCAELCWQLRKQAGKRQVPGATLALQHNIGLGGAAVVALYKMGFPEAQRVISIHPTAAIAASPEGFQSTAVFEEIKHGLQMDGEMWTKKMGGVYLFKVTGGPKGEEAHWIVDVKNGKGSVEYNGKAKTDCTISMADKDFLDLMFGKLDPQRAFFQGKLKIAGNIALALKLQQFTKALPKANM